MRSVLLLSFAVIGVALLPVWRSVDPRLGAPASVISQAPPGITGALRTITAPGDRIWNFQPWGSWFEFALPDRLVGFDSRAETIPATAWQDYVLVHNANRNWPTILDRWAVTVVVVTHGDDQFTAALGDSPLWRQRYADSDGAIWVRADRP